MHEHVGPVVYYLEVHFLYASIICLSAWVLTSVWNGSATWKYWIWVATLLNFILPFGGFVDRFGASSVSWATQLPGLDEIGMGISRHLAAGGYDHAVATRDQSHHWQHCQPYHGSHAGHPQES